MLWRIIWGPTATLVRQVLAAMAQFDETMTVAKLRLARDPHPQARVCGSEIPCRAARPSPWPGNCIDGTWIIGPLGPSASALAMSTSAVNPATQGCAGHAW